MEHIKLVGSEQAQAAARQMHEAAGDMLRAANTLALENERQRPCDDAKAVMSRMGERAIMVANGEACHQCLHTYPAPTTYVESVTCSVCGCVNILHGAGSSLERNQQKNPSWTWVQPSDRTALLQRLADARDFDVSARERENLCSVAHRDIARLQEALQNLVDDSYAFVEQPSWIRPATGLGVYRCYQCEALKGDKSHPHADNCAVELAETVLRGKP